MEVKIGITHNCELLVQGTEDSLEYVRIGNELKELLDPYSSDTLTTEELRENKAFMPCDILSRWTKLLWVAAYTTRWKAL